MFTPAVKERVLAEYKSTVWGNPSMETNTTIIPAKLTVTGPRRSGMDVQNVPLLFPDSNVLYHLYTFGRLHSWLLYQLGLPANQWMRLPELMEANNAFLRLGYLNTLKVPDLANTYLLYYPGIGLLMAVPDDGVKAELHFSARTSKSNLNTTINVASYDFPTQTERDTVATQIANDTEVLFKEYYLDNAWVDKPTHAQINAAKNLTIIDDTSIEQVVDMEMADLVYYEDNEEKNYYLLHLPELAKGTFLHANDVIVVLMNGQAGHPILHRAYPGTLVQLAGNAYGLSAAVVESALSSLGWTYAQTNVRLMLGSADAKTKLYNYYYQRSWDLMSVEQQRDALLDVGGAPDILTAKYRQVSTRMRYINADVDVITKNVDSLYHMGEYDRITNRGIREGSSLDLNLTKLVGTRSKVSRTYVDGVPSVDNPTALVGNENALWLDSTLPLSYASSTMPMSAYTIPVVYKQTGELATLNVDYKVDSDTIYPITACYITELLSSRTISPTMVSEGVYAYDLKVLRRFCDLHVFLDRVYLHPGVDYKVNDDGIVVWKAVDFGVLEIKVSPKLTNAIVETGFVRNGTLSVNGSYLIEDPDNCAVFVGDKLYMADDITWEEQYQLSTANLPNGKPYTVVKRLLNNYALTAAEIKAKRDAHQAELVEIATYINMDPPSTIDDPSYYSELYNLLSPFLVTLVKAMRDGLINFSRTYVELVGVRKAVGDTYLAMLEDGNDPVTIEWASKAINIAPHKDDTPQTMTADAYFFMELVNQELLGGKVQLNRYYRIVK